MTYWKRLKFKYAFLIPSPSKITITTTATGSAFNNSLITKTFVTGRANCHPFGKSFWDWERVSNCYLKISLHRIDLCHTFMKVRPVSLFNFQDKIYPGMNHFMAQGTLQCLLGKILQYWSRQYYFTSFNSEEIRFTSIDPSRSAHAAITPTNRDSGNSILEQRVLKILPV